MPRGGRRGRGGELSSKTIQFNPFCGDGQEELEVWRSTADTPISVLLFCFVFNFCLEKGGRRSR